MDIKKMMRLNYFLIEGKYEDQNSDVDESNMPVNAQDPRWGIVETPKIRIFGEAKGKYPEIQPAIDTVEDIYTMLDIVFDDAQSAIASIDGKDARSFKQAMDMMEKSADFMMKLLRKHK